MENFPIVKVFYFDGSTRKISRICRAFHNGVCVLPDKQFIMQRRIIKFVGLSFTNLKRKSEQLKWLSCLAWLDSDREKAKKRKRWREFHQRRKARKIEKKAFSARRSGVCVPPPNVDPEVALESRARRVLGANSDKRACLAALRSLSSDDAVELNNGIGWFSKHKLTDIDPATYKVALRITGISDALVSHYYLDESGYVHVRGLTQRDVDLMYTRGDYDEINRRKKTYASVLKEHLGTLLKP